MQISIKVDTWPQAHHLGCILADAEYAFRQRASEWGKQDAVSEALEAYAKFFRQIAREVTKQAGPLNV